MSDMNREGSDGDIWAIVPVKRLRLAKSRLVTELGDATGTFMRALARHTVQTLVSAPEIAQVLVVTADSEIAADAIGAGALVLGEDGHGLNDALVLGIDHARSAGAATCMAVPADLPLLSTGCLTEIVGAFAAHGRSGLGVVRCKDGDGTTVTIFPANAAVRPCYGPDSFATHMAMPGLVTFAIDARQAAFDVDTPADLERLSRIDNLDPALSLFLQTSELSQTART